MSEQKIKPNVITGNSLLKVSVKTDEVKLLVIGGGKQAYDVTRALINDHQLKDVILIAAKVDDSIKTLDPSQNNLEIIERNYEQSDFNDVSLVVAATGNDIINERIKSEASVRNLLVNIPGSPELSDFILTEIKATNGEALARKNFIERFNSGEVRWKRLASQLIIVFTLMVIGHIIISYLPLPSLGDAWTGIEPYLTGKFFFFILAGFLAQMVDGSLGMGYGVTSATVLMSTGISPVSVSAAIHTSEIFTTGVSGFSHYKFGNVNKKLFKHLVIPGVIGAALGAGALVWLGSTASKWLMPTIALYALFLGVKIILKAFKQNTKNTKLKRVGWLAWIGGFLDSFGGGGWGPIVTSTLISKGRSPRFTVGTVSLTEFFVTMASAFTFFLTVGISHWNVVLGLLIGGSIAAPFAARLVGKLPKKTMMIAVGIMVIIWCIRMILKSF
jgi:uncharacterized membrane protein YfcA